MEDFRPFFKEYNDSWYKNIKGFAMNQNAQYNRVVKEEAPWITYSRRLPPHVEELHL